jgi:hypothetical protein
MALGAWGRRRQKSIKFNPTDSAARFQSSIISNWPGWYKFTGGAQSESHGRLSASNTI